LPDEDRPSSLFSLLPRNLTFFILNHFKNLINFLCVIEFHLKRNPRRKKKTGYVLQEEKLVYGGWCWKHLIPMVSPSSTQWPSTSEIRLVMSYSRSII
jgi:hypothetical protein